MSTTREDLHRPGAIEPEKYAHLVYYHLATTASSWPVPPYNMDVVVRLQDEARESGRAVFGAPGKCGVCGAAYVYGELWRHEPTGDLVHLGHDCALKYELIADRRAFEAEIKRGRVRASREHERAMKRERFDALVAAHPGLAEAFEVEHRIVQDVAERARKYGKISDKQVQLVLRLARESAQPRDAEALVAAPEGKVTFEGEVLSVREKNSRWGGLAMTVKVRTVEGGTWLAWGTCPRSLLGHPTPLRGARVRVTATLKRGRDPHFAIMSRAQAEVLSEAAAA